MFRTAGLAFAYLALTLHASAFAQSVSAEKVVVTPADFGKERGIEFHPDGPMVTLKDKGGRPFWITAIWDKTRGQILHMKTEGDVDRPYAQTKWIKTQDEFFKYDESAYSGNFWLVNQIQAADGVLGFVHVEHFMHSGTDPKTHRDSGTGKSHIAIAWSVDGGDSFTLIGDIITPWNDPDPFNIQGVPVIVKGGYIYIYYKEPTGAAVARAKLADVVDAARRLKTSPWLKYAGVQAGYTSDGLGGKAAPVNLPGILHTDGVLDGKTAYALASRMSWPGDGTWVRLLKSDNMVDWLPAVSIADEPADSKVRGYQYCSITSPDGEQNTARGDSIFVYCAKDYDQPSREFVRWRVDLASPPPK